MEEEKKRKVCYKCNYCSLTTLSVVTFCIHIMGSKHHKNVKLSRPDLVPLIPSIHDFVDVYMKEVLGMEYVEVNAPNLRKYTVTCHLCHVNKNKSQIISHLLSLNHMERYVSRHHPLLLDHEYWQLSLNAKKNLLQTAASMIHHQPGGTNELSIAADADAPPPSKVAKYTDPNQATIIYVSEEAIDPQQSASMGNTETLQKDMTEKLKFLQIKDNTNFLNHLRDFEIRNDEDAKYLSEITKNCAKAMTRFQEVQNLCGVAGAPLQ